LLIGAVGPRANSLIVDPGTGRATYATLPMQRDERRVTLVARRSPPIARIVSRRERHQRKTD
jgi:hypothetical protein